VELRLVDVNKDNPFPDIQPRQAELASASAWIALLFPAPHADPDAPREVALTAPLTAEATEHLLDSPKRREIARMLLAGESVVWLLLESGEKEKDEAASMMLATELAKSQSSEQSTLNRDDPPAIDLSNAIPLKVAFSKLHLSRSDPAEKHFVQLLLTLYPALREVKEPILFPIFGRGRALGAAAGTDLKPLAISKGCEFLIGDCACEIKEQNPGRDLLMAVNWNAHLTGPLASDTPVPPLTGVLAAATTAPAQIPAASAVAPDTLWRNILFTLLGVALIAAGLTWFTLRRSRKEAAS
jgi:hypothetical protein